MRIEDRLGERLVNLVWAHLPMQVGIMAYGPVGQSPSTEFRILVRHKRESFVQAVPTIKVLDAVKFEELDVLAGSVAKRILARIKKGK